MDAGTTPGRDGEVAPPMDGEVDRDSGPPPAMGCGNGVMDPGEECDDGNTAPFDGCQPDCTLWEAAAGEPLVPDAPRTWQYFEIEGDRSVHLGPHTCGQTGAARDHAGQKDPSSCGPSCC